MIKSVVVPRLVAHNDELDRIRGVLSELGFQDGDGWHDARSKGSPMVAPSGVLEFYHGQPPAPAEVIVEVEDLQHTLDVVRRHGMKVLSEVSPTHWGSDLFVCDIGGCHVAFFRWSEQARVPYPAAA